MMHYESVYMCHCQYCHEILLIQIHIHVITSLIMTSSYLDWGMVRARAFCNGNHRRPMHQRMACTSKYLPRVVLLFPTLASSSPVAVAGRCRWSVA
jgi:hypothetical protein